jgi:hypothetical protein
VLTYQYNVLRDDLSDALPYPAGGAIFRNALLYACLAAAESLQDKPDRPHERTYQMYLKQAFDWDARSGATFMGVNRDASSGDRVWEPVHYATFNGTVPAP